MSISDVLTGIIFVVVFCAAIFYGYTFAMDMHALKKARQRNNERDKSESEAASGKAGS